MSAVFFLAALLHPVHATYAELDWNDDAKVVEVALRLHPLDEQTIDKRAETRSRPIAVPAGQSQPNRKTTARLEYLAEHFAVDPPADDSFALSKAAQRYHWIGREEKAGYVWWFFEIKPASGERPKELRQTVLLDHDQRYGHRVLLLGTPERPTLPFDKNTTRQELSWGVAE